MFHIDIDTFRETLAFLPYQKLYGAALALVFFLNWGLAGTLSIVLKFSSRECCNNKGVHAEDQDYHNEDHPAENGSFFNSEAYGNTWSANRGYNTFPQDNINLVDPNKKKQWKCLDYIAELFSWVAYMSFAAISVCLSAFDITPLWSSILITFLLGLLKLNKNIHQIYAFQNEETSSSPKRVTSFVQSWKFVMSRHSKLFIFGVAVVTGTALIAPLITHKSCIVDHTVGYGISLLNGKVIYSSSLVRYLTLDKVCGGEAPCHIYATVPFDTSSSVFINVHTNIHVKEIVVNYEKSSVYSETGSLPYSETSSYTIHQEYDYVGERNIHNVLLQNLAPNTLYTVEIYYNGKTQATTTYQTLPGTASSDNFTLIYSGDAGYNLNSQQMTPVIAEQNPSALIIGGDIAYDDGANSCYYTMDLFLSMVEKGINEKLGRLVPLILGVGNHDVGFNSMWRVKMEVNEKGPSYYVNFPQSLPVNSKGQVENRAPKVKERNSYHTHMIGNILNVILDSGYMTPHGGGQAKWLEGVSKTYKDHPKVAVYHDPIFPPCYHPYASSNTTKAGIENWVPVFTEYKFMAAFENHAHAYKRTYPMKGAEKAADGVGIVYLGDGAWGPESSCKLKDYSLSKDIYQSVSGVNNVWVVEVDPKNNKVAFEPIGKDNAPVDTVTVQDISNFVDL